MTAYRFVTLTCDGCGEIWDSGSSRTVADARATARGAGWLTRPRGEDLCPVCGRGWRRTPHGYDDSPL